jgi:chromatin remodeling complex protein RSC6
MRKFDSRVDKGVLFGYSSTRKTYKCYNLILNKVVERINITIDETGRTKSKEENESMKQPLEEEVEDEKEVEDEDEENPTEGEEQVQQVSPKTPNK